jgi:hypothetical protein
MDNSITGANFKAINEVVRIVHEFDRYHGYFPAARRSPPTRGAWAWPKPRRGGARASRGSLARWKWRRKPLRKFIFAMEMARSEVGERRRRDHGDRRDEGTVAR